MTMFLHLSVNAQVIDVPKKAKEHFFKKYPDAKNADWNNNVVNYTVKFLQGESTFRAYYYINGNWHYTEKYLIENQLPPAVAESFAKSRYAEWTKDSFAWIENNKNISSWRIEVKKGIEKKSIFFDKNGKELKSSPTL
jgi:hypothetical protein